VYADNREIAQDYKAGQIWAGVDVIYRSLICEIICDFVDDDGLTFLELLSKNVLEPEITFTVER